MDSTGTQRALDAIADAIRATPLLTADDVMDIASCVDWDDDIDRYVSDAARPVYDALVAGVDVTGWSAELIMDMVTTTILGW